MTNLKIRKILYNNTTEIDLLGPTDLKSLEMLNVLEKKNNETLLSDKGIQIMLPDTDIVLKM